MASQGDLTEFIASSFRSVWAIEVLCQLRASPKQEFDPSELVAALRASELIVRQSMAELGVAGLTVQTDDGKVRYAPTSRSLDTLAEAACARYAAAPSAVRRIIVRSANPDLAAFSDAFRFKERP